jgi:mono/diheme cytochrome c family protein
MIQRPHSNALAYTAALAALGLVTSCTPGAYPLDFFNEMHYQPSQRREEPQRLAPPPDAVPVTGARTPFNFEQASFVQNPVARTPQDVERGHAVYRVNCVACHGQNGDGQGMVASYFISAGFVPPVAFTSDRVRSRSDGQLYWLITYGVGNMPAFKDLLDDQDVWRLVLAIREFEGSGKPSSASLSRDV